MKPVRDLVFRLASVLGLDTVRAQAYVNSIPSAKLSAIVGLTIIALAIVLMVAGSLIFPDRGTSLKASRAAETQHKE
ncbi:MAG: hypothetical protein ACYS9C_12985 [Planctomycetota bacterium]